MKVKEIRILNCYGIEELTIQPGTLTVISGRNAAGKSSAINALKLVLSGGHEPDAIRQGAEQAEIKLTMADGVTITKSITPAKSTLTVRDPELGKISKSQAWINQVVDSVSLDPVAFLDAVPKARLDALLSAIPMRVQAAELGFVPVEALRGIDLDRHALEVLGQVGKTIYDLRTGANRAAREKRATASQMTATLPAAPAEGNWPAELERRAAAARKLQKSTAERVQVIKLDAEHAKQAQVALYQVAREKVLAELEAERDKQVTGIERHRDEALRAAEVQYRPENVLLVEAVAEAKAAVSAVEKAASTRSFIVGLETDAEKLEGEAHKLTEGLDELGALKTRLLQSIPIPGLEIRDGDIRLNGIPFAQVNESERYRIAIEVARLKAGELGLIVLDRAEIFDSRSWKSFRQAALASGLQIVTARVSDGPLEVQSAETSGITLDEGADELINGAF